MLRELTPQMTERELQNGRLIDLSELAPDGCSKRIFATSTLWQSLLWSYPTAQTADVIDPVALICDLGLACSNPFAASDEPTMLFPHVPRQKPAWLPKDFTITVYVQPFGTLLKLTGERIPDPKHKAPLLPSGLLIKLIRLLARLKQVARSHDRPVVQKLTAIIHTISNHHPLQKELAAAGPAITLSFPRDLSQDEYRTLLINDLANLLEVALACGLRPDTGAAFANYFDKLRSPLHELLHVVRSLILLAAAVPAPSVHLSPLDDLLTAYGSLSKLIDQPSPTISKDVLEMLDTDAFVLSQILPSVYSEEFAQLRQTLAVLRSISSTFAVGTTYPPQYYIYH